MRRFSWITTMAATIGMLVSSASFAQNQANQNQEQGRNRSANQNQARDAEQSGQLPQALQELDLTSEQKQKIRQTNQEISQKIQETWRKFHQAHMQAVTLEATWHAAVRDTLSEEDQKKFDEQRKQQQARESREARAQAGQRESNRAEIRRNRRENRRNREADDSTQPDQDRRTAAQDADESQRRSGFRPGDQSQDEQGLVVIMLTSPTAYTSGTQQTPEQKQKCSEACQEYAKELTTAWKKVHEFHHELVKLEAQRLSEIEAHLNEDQLKELKKSRESASQN